MRFLEQLIGTRTKIRIIGSLVKEAGPLSRNKLASSAGTGTGPVYEQVDQLIALGVLKEEGGAISLDDDFPYLEILKELILLTEDHMEDLRGVLVSIDRVLGEDHYISGCLSASRNGFPMDREINTVLVMVKDLDRRRERMLEAIDLSCPYDVQRVSTGSIPSDVERTEFLGAEIWASSVERGIVESIRVGECDSYVIFLLLVQNIFADTLDVGRILKIADEEEIGDEMRYALSLISRRLPEMDLRIDTDIPPFPDIKKAVEMSLNTVMG